jgi:hypothetical protein
MDDCSPGPYPGWCNQAQTAQFATASSVPGGQLRRKVINMSALFGIFGLGPAEVLVLLIAGGVPVLAAVIVLLVILRINRKKDDAGNE